MTYILGGIGKKTGGQGNKGKLRIWTIYESIFLGRQVIGISPSGCGGNFSPASSC